MSYEEKKTLFDPKNKESILIYLKTAGMSEALAEDFYHYAEIGWRTSHQDPESKALEISEAHSLLDKMNIPRDENMGDLGVATLSLEGRLGYLQPNTALPRYDGKTWEVPA